MAAIAAKSAGRLNMVCLLWLGEGHLHIGRMAGAQVHEEAIEGEIWAGRSEAHPRLRPVCDQPESSKRRLEGIDPMDRSVGQCADVLGQP
jgi:hypothetical protein